jgi:hypothetical protein
MKAHLVNKTKFMQHYSQALEDAAHLTEQQLGRTVPRSYEILLHGAGHSGDIMSAEEALDILYLGNNLFYRVIDFSVSEVRPGVTTVFVRPSSHPPAPWHQTGYGPPDPGPFHQLGPRIPITFSLR